MLPQNEQISRGVHRVMLVDDRFKTAQLNVALFLPLCADTVEEYALLPRLLTRACASCPDFTALQRRLSGLYGAAITGEATRIGETQALVFTAECTADRFALGDESLTEACAKLLCDMLFHPAFENGHFRDTDVETERRCLAEEVSAQINEKQWYARRQAEKLLCDGEPYALGRYGEVSRIEALTPAQLTVAWKRALQQAQVQLIFQDDRPLPAVERLFEEGFASVGGRDPLPLSAVAASASDTVRRKTERMEVNQCKLVMGLRTPCYGTDPRVPATRLMCAMLGGTATSLLMRNVREKLSLCYYCSAQYDRLKGVMFIQSGVDEKNVKQTEKEILNQLETIRNGAFADSELEDARRTFLQAFEAVGDAQSSLGAWYVSQGMSETFESPEMTKQKIAAVTREQVIRAARDVRLECVYLLAPKEGIACE